MNKNNQEYLVQKIRTRYTEKQHTELDELKVLDRKVKAPADAFAWSFGAVAALIMGSGMSLIMTDLSDWLGLEDSMVPGIIIGVMGMAMAVVNYPVYRKLLRTRRKRFAPQIIALSDSIVNN